MDILKDKQYREFDILSKYSNTPYYYNEIDNKYMCGLGNRLNKGTNYIQYKIQNGDTLDKIALKFYQNPSYYWIIADFNNIIDAFVDLKVGALLYIPTLSNVKFEDV